MCSIPFLKPKFRLAVGCLGALVRLLYGQRLTDEATCYKAFRTSLLRELNLQGERFEFCAEVTAKVCRRGIAVVEVPIGYPPRSAGEGKKIGWRDLLAHPLDPPQVALRPSSQGPPPRVRVCVKLVRATNPSRTG